MSEGRRQRQRAATRAQILVAAVEIAEADGWGSVTMRKIAERIDYTHAALYAYFATKDDLLLALFHEGTELLLVAMDAARTAAVSPEDALIAVVQAYWAFAWAHPELYQVMNGLAGVTLAHPETVREGRRIGDAVGAAIHTLPTIGEYSREDTDAAVALLWSTLHGLVALTMSGRFSQEQATALVARAARDALLTWGAGPQRSD